MAMQEPSPRRRGRPSKKATTTTTVATTTTTTATATATATDTTTITTTTKRSTAPPSGGGGRDLPALDYNVRAGKSSISGNGTLLPRTGKVDKGGAPALPRGSGPHPDAWEPRARTSAEATGSVAGMPADAGTGTGAGRGVTDPRGLKGILGNKGGVKGVVTGWVA